jgi:flagellar hook capping protein FlgD/parallel beta helix pectate lyase-like protein
MGLPIVVVHFLRRCRLATFLSALFLPGIVSAREIVVAPSGGDFATIAAGVGAAQAGDTVTVRAGIYNGAVSFGRSGSAAAFITLRGQPGAILDGASGSGQGITISSRNYIRVTGMTVRNFKGSGTPMGISVEGSSSFIELRNNLIHNVESPNDNAHGIAFYGTAATPMTNIVVEGNEIRNCRLGQSESLVLNGNVSGFTVAKNLVHDNDNIGIDFIGFEGTGPLGQDQARNGICVDNVVYNISSATNPTYFGDRSADGIYVDGGRDIVIERNKVDNCDIGVEVASEHLGKTTSNITVRNNFISRGYQGNILMGGYDAARGNAQNVVVVNNTTYQGTYGEIELQYNCDGITIKNNILDANAGQPYISNGGGNNTNVTVGSNIYFGASSTSPGSYPDASARFVNPLLVTPLTDLHLQAGSPAIDAGINLGNDAQGQPLSGVSSIDGTPRVHGSAIDIGADEFGAVTSVGGSNSPPSPNLMAHARPNPFNPLTTIIYTVATAGRVSLRIFDASGRLVRTLADVTRRPGQFTATWDGKTDSGTPSASGAYFLQARFADGTKAQQKVTLAR